MTIIIIIIIKIIIKIKNLTHVGANLSVVGKKENERKVGDDC